MIGGESVWKRTTTENPLISERVYNLTIGAVLLWGFALNYYTVITIPVETVLAIPQLVLLLGYFASVIIGTMMFTKSDNPLISFIGYNFVVVPIGIILTPFLHQFDSAIITDALLVTGGVTGVMMLMGATYPKFFLSLGRVLGLSLLLVIVIELILMFFFNANPEIIDWIVVVIFCGYIGFDWARANQIPKTLDNAVDSAAALYLDIINLFIRILSIMGRRR